MAVAANRTYRIKMVNAPAPKLTQEEGEKAFPHAVEMVLYIACLHSSLYNLADEMAEIGEYKHSKKKWLNQARENIGSLHQGLHKSLMGHSEIFGLWYNAQFEKAENTINECIAIEPPHRAYSIVMALFRMVEKANNKCGRYRSPIIIAYLPEAKKLVDRCAFPAEDKNIDFILESNIDTKTLTYEIEDKL